MTKNKKESEAPELSLDEPEQTEPENSSKLIIEEKGVGLSTKTLSNTDQNGTRDNVPDVVIFGEDLFKLLSKASSEKEGWMKSTKAMQVAGGCVVQVTTQQRNADFSYSVAEALTFVPNCRIVGNEYGRRLK